MTTTTTDNQEVRMRRYLLGELPEAEQLALETEFFADASLLEQMQDIETDLQTNTFAARCRTLNANSSNGIT